jgi:hypothetical protein
MQQDQRQMCAYCSKWFYINDMVELREKGKSVILHYCMACYPEVKANLNSLPWKDDFTFYRH